MPNSVSASMKACTAVSGTGLSTMLNRPQAPVKSRFQIAWPGQLSSAGMQHARDLRPLREPARDLQPGLIVMRKPHRHGAQAAQAEIHVVGTDAQPHREYGVD